MYVKHAFVFVFAPRRLVDYVHCMNKEIRLSNLSHLALQQEPKRLLTVVVTGVVFHKCT
jgi:hypothetical protein